MVEEKVYCRYIPQHSQRRGLLGKSRVDMTRLSWTMWRQEEGEKGERGTRCGSQEGKGTKRKGNQKDAIEKSLPGKG